MVKMGRPCWMVGLAFRFSSVWRMKTVLQGIYSSVEVIDRYEDCEFRMAVLPR